MKTIKHKTWSYFVCRTCKCFICKTI